MLAASLDYAGMASLARALARNDLVRQVVIVVGSFEVYEVARHFIEPNWSAAVANAHRILHLEQALHFAWEQSMQARFLELPELVRAMNVFYFVGHFVLTGVFFTWLYFRSRHGFRSFRNGFLIATAISLLIHWKFPTAPPRLAQVGLEDTLRQLSDIDIGSRTKASYSNPVAAVPSLHAGWAVGVACGVVRYTRSRAVKGMAILYPLLVVLTIVVTGNHFFLDAVAGVIVMAVGFLAASALVRREPSSREGGVILASATRGGAVR